jgi:anti-anti-sigma factor
MLEVVRDESKALVKIDRNIIASNTDKMGQELKDLLREELTDLVIDLSKVEIIDSSGLKLLIAIHHSLAKANGRLSIVNASRNIIKLFKSMRLDQHIRIIDEQT